MARSREREQFLADIITTAIEGGTGYWAVVHAYRWEDRPPHEVYAVIMEEDDEHEAELRDAIRMFMAAHDRKPKIADLLDYKIDDKPLVYKIDIETIARGIAEIKREIHICRSDIREGILRADRENDAGEIDADGADVIVQAALFKELVYG